ncbi:TPA: hypothetical protein ACU203_002500 [Mannheimia haemolytica]
MPSWGKLYTPRVEVQHSSAVMWTDLIIYVHSDDFFLLLGTSLLQGRLKPYLSMQLTK